MAKAAALGLLLLAAAAAVSATEVDVQAEEVGHAVVAQGEGPFTRALLCGRA